MKFLKDTFIQSLIKYILSVGWFGGIGYLIISSEEPIILKIFYFIGLGWIVLRWICELNDGG